MNDPQTRAGKWLLERSDWIDGLRAFRVRINATAGPDDMHRHILAIEDEAREQPSLKRATASVLAAAQEAREDERARIRAAVEALDHRRCGPVYEGCYSHWASPHCRADGMGWPCDMVTVLAILEESTL